MRMERTMPESAEVVYWRPWEQLSTPSENDAAREGKVHTKKNGAERAGKASCKPWGVLGTPARIDAVRAGGVSWKS